MDGNLEERYRRHPMVAPIYKSVGELDARLGRIENALAAILERLRMPTLETFAKAPVAPAAPATPPPASPAAAAPATAIPARLEPEPYAYGPLAQDEIRLLLVENKEADCIKAQLIHVNLNWRRGVISSVRGMTDKVIPQFTALSYAWGEPKFDGSIALDGHRFPVTRNVETAFRHILKTKPGSKSCWWVDQICINQADIDERSQQVGLMRRIYKTASVVTVWLGEAADDSDLAMQLLNDMGNDKSRGPGQKELKYEPASPEKTEQHWQAISALFSRPWWERAWVRQEVALNYSPTVFCGAASCPFTTLAAAAEAFANLDQSGGFVPDTIRQPFYRQAQLLAGIKAKTRNGSRFTDLAICLVLSRASKATDPRDKVFSVIGLTDPDVHKLAADYRQPLKDVLVAAARSVLPTCNGLDLLAACQNPERRHGLPSWVPNLSDLWKSEPIEMVKRKRKSYVTPDVQFENEVLRISGVHIDAVQSLCELVVQQNDTSEALSSLYTTWKEFTTQVLRCSKAGYDQKEFVKTLVGDSADTMWAYMLAMGDETPYQILSISQHSDVHFADMLLQNLNHKFITANFLLGKNLKATPERMIDAMLRKYCIGRRLCLSEKGFVGIVPAESRAGDSIVMFYGGQFASILRKIDEGNRYVLVGEAFFPGIEPIKKQGQYIEVV